MRRVVFVVVALFALLTPARALATVPPGDDGTAATDGPTTTVDNRFLDTERDLTECLNNSVQLPGCGTAATEAGDRGGVLQGVTFGLLALAIAFITWRVARSIKARDAAVLAAHPDARQTPGS